MKVQSKSSNVIVLHTVRTASDSLYASVSPVLTGLNNHHKASAGLYRGSCYSLSPLDYIEAIQDKGVKQANLFPVSAGNDLRMSTMRPNPFKCWDRVMKGLQGTASV